VICVLLLQAAAASAAPQVPAAKHKGRGSKSKAAQQAAAAGGSGAEAAAAAAAAILEDGNKLQLAGLVAVMGKLASAEPLVSVCVCGGRGCPRKGVWASVWWEGMPQERVLFVEGGKGCHGQRRGVSRSEGGGGLSWSGGGGSWSGWGEGAVMV
jgi:hypothetical protein